MDNSIERRPDADEDGSDDAMVVFNNHIANLSPKKRVFLESFISHHGQSKPAARAAGVSISATYLWRRKTGGQDFLKCFAAAQEIVTQKMIEESRRRASEGSRKYKYTTRGEPILDLEGNHAYDTIYSDLLMMFLLKGAMPLTYRDQYQGPQVAIVGKSITLHHGPSATNVSDQ